MADENYNNNESDDDILFYTPKIAQYIDDSNILEHVFRNFQKLKDANETKNEKDERKAFIEFIQSKDLVNDILNQYSISIIDLIRIFAKKYSYIFNTVTYTNKVKSIIEANGYSTEEKQ